MYTSITDNSNIDKFTRKIELNLATQQQEWSKYTQYRSMRLVTSQSKETVVIYNI
jgi:hypothetical protein